jgi:hydrogenase expression/formation protein HypE
LDKPNNLIQSFTGPVCPTPIHPRELVVMGHGSGGDLSHALIKDIFLPAFQNSALMAGNDSAIAELPTASTLTGKLAFTTDSHVVCPLFFPGGDIGILSVSGTVNDLITSGALPLYLCAGFIIEEGFSIRSLQQIAASMAITAEKAGVKIIAGDTKVVERGKADGVYITTSGIGWIPTGRQIDGRNARPGDIVIVSGSMGDHGIAVLCARGQLGLETNIQSDVAPLNQLIETLLSSAPNTHVLRDPTRGGLATTLNEIARQSKVCIEINQDAVPVNPAVAAACELLGFDPLYIANEGKMIIIVPPQEAETAMAAIRSHPDGKQAAIIGEVKEKPANRVLLRTPLGSRRILEMLTGELLPRIC